jgi:hypothetical protein
LVIVHSSKFLQPLGTGATRRQRPAVCQRPCRQHSTGIPHTADTTAGYLTSFQTQQGHQAPTRCTAAPAIHVDKGASQVDERCNAASAQPSKLVWTAQHRHTTHGRHHWICDKLPNTAIHSRAIRHPHAAPPHLPSTHVDERCKVDGTVQRRQRPALKLPPYLRRHDTGACWLVFLPEAN